MKTPARKLAVVAAIVAFTTGVSGYFMGLLQADRAAATRSTVNVIPTPAQSAHLAAPEAPRYADLRQRTLQPNHAWHSSLSTLPPAPTLSAPAPRLSTDELKALLVKRDSRRAYSGAPPTVPHPIDQYESTACLACHGHPSRIAHIDVPQISHPIYSQCIQCHAPSAGTTPVPPLPAQTTPVLANAFVGQPTPTNGTRAYLGAPPTMPHTTEMRQNCVTCHGPAGSSVIKTTHPDRQNCLQCHATDSHRETHPPTPLSAPVAQAH